MGLPRPPQRGGYVRLHSQANFMSDVAKNRGHSDFCGDTTRSAQTVSPLVEIPARFLTRRDKAGSGRHVGPRAVLFVEILEVRDVPGSLVCLSFLLGERGGTIGTVFDTLQIYTKLYNHETFTSTTTGNCGERFVVPAALFGMC